jgi:glycosyltransferase involved in cell wall biosynthesis
MSTEHGAAATDAAPLKVAVSMLSLVPGGMGGSETYARELVRELAGSHDVAVQTWVAGVGAGFSTGVPEHVVAGVTGGPGTGARVATLAQAWRQRRRIHRGLAHADVVHYPFTAPVPWPARRPAVAVSLLDVQHLDLPHLFSRAERMYRRRWYDAAARRADVVVTISTFAKQGIVDHLGVDPDRVHVAHLGVDASEFTPNFDEREPFLLYPARGWAHKNHARLVEAVRLLRADDPGLRLVLTGGGLEGLGDLPDWVDVRGLVSREELRSLYRRASCLVFPSRYEGFGLPPLEAMASGCPVAASTAGSLPEVCGDAAVLFDPEDPQAIADGVRSALERSAELAAAGPAQAARFTWAACADAHVAAYRAAAGR